MKNFMCLTNTIKSRIQKRDESAENDHRGDGDQSVNCQLPGRVCIDPPRSVSPSRRGLVGKQKAAAAGRVVRTRLLDNRCGCVCSCSAADAGCDCVCNCSSSGGGVWGGPPSRGRRHSFSGKNSNSNRRSTKNYNNSSGKGGNKSSEVVMEAAAPSSRLEERSRSCGALPQWWENAPQPPPPPPPAFGKDDGDAVKVVVRMRPPNEMELSQAAASALEGGDFDDDNSTCCVRQLSDESLCIVTPPDRMQFSYDYVAGPSVSQEAVFGYAGKSVVENCLSGYNSCIFAYGQTGSGKTYTMLGDIPEGADAVVASAGLIPRVFQYLLGRISQIEGSNSSVKYLCRCSLLEIYNERITDLLTQKSSLQIREDTERGVYVKGLTLEDVFTVEDALSLLRRGSINRRVGETGMNSKSSRSHCVLTCVIERRSTDHNGLTNTFRSRLNLVDLAGSERQRTSGAAGHRLKEASSINRSLSTLALVIMSLVELQQGKKSKHIPYRDSKLTFLLQDSLGGNSKTVMIANVSPAACNLSETISTLRFAKTAKCVKNRAIVNEDITGDARLLALEIARLKAELSRYRAQLEPEEHRRSAKRDDGLTVSLAEVREPRPSEVDPLALDALRREDAAVKKAALLEAQFVQAQLVIKFKDLEVKRLERLVTLRDGTIRRLEAENSAVATDGEAADLRSEVEMLKEKLAAHPEVAMLSAENKQLKQELAAMRASAAERERAEDENNRLRAKVLELVKEVEEARSGVLPAVEEDSRRAPETPAINIRGVEELKKQLEEEAANVEDAMHCNRILADEILQLENTIDRLREEGAHFSQEKELLAKEAQACAEEARLEIRNVQRELADVNVEKQELENLLTEALQAKHEVEMQCNEVSGRLLEFVHLNDDLRREKRQLEEQVKVLQTQRNDRQVMTTNVDVQTSGDCCNSVQEVAELRNQLREERGKNSTLLREFDNLASQLEHDVQGEIADCKNQLDWLLGELEETQQELDRTKGTLADREMDIDDMQQALTAVACSLEVYKSKCGMLENDLHNQLLSKDELEKTNESLAVELDKLRQEAKITVSKSKVKSSKDIVLHPWLRKARMEHGRSQRLVKSGGVDQDNTYREGSASCHSFSEKNIAVSELSDEQMEAIFREELNRDGSGNESEFGSLCI